MPRPEKRHRHQTAVLWSFSGYDRDGRATVGTTPTEIKVRWIDKRSEMTDADGNTIIVDAQVIVAQDIAAGSILWLGELADLVGTAGPGEDVFQVIKVAKTPSTKGRAYQRTLGLMRFKTTLPTLT